MKKLLIATKNSGKIKEIKELLKDIPYELVTLNQINFSQEIAETGKSFKENAILKAQIIGEKTGMLTLAEDSGLEVDALGKKPGILSARYAKGTDRDRLFKLLKELEGLPKEKRTARFKAVVAVYDPQTKKTVTFHGVSEGYITEKPMGKSGFGYDPIFFNLDLGKTNACALLKEKNMVSHRSRAFSQVRRYLLEILN